MEKVWILIDLCDFLDNVSYLIPLFIYHECVVIYIYISNIHISYIHDLYFMSQNLQWQLTSPRRSEKVMEAFGKRAEKKNKKTHPETILVTS